MTKIYEIKRPRIYRHYKAAKQTVSEGRYVTALVSVVGNIDYQGDRVRSGAFTESLAKWRASGNPIPCVWSHDWANPFAHIGSVTDARETPRGLEVDDELDVDRNVTAKQVGILLAERRVTQWSFAYDVIEEQRARDGANDLIKLDLIEIGPCLVGANNQTQTLDSKGIDELFRKTRPPFGRQPVVPAAAKATDATADLRAHLMTQHGVPASRVIAPRDDEIFAMHQTLHDSGRVTADHTHADIPETVLPPKRRADDDLLRKLDELEFGVLKRRVASAEVDAFIAQVRAELRAERAREAERARLIAMTNATPAGDAPRVGPDMQPVE